MSEHDMIGTITQACNILSSYDARLQTYKMKTKTNQQGIIIHKLLVSFCIANDHRYINIHRSVRHIHVH